MEPEITANAHAQNDVNKLEARIKNLPEGEAPFFVGHIPGITATFNTFFLNTRSIALFRHTTPAHIFPYHSIGGIQDAGNSAITLSLKDGTEFHFKKLKREERFALTAAIEIFPAHGASTQAHSSWLTRRKELDSSIPPTSREFAEAARDAARKERQKIERSKSRAIVERARMQADARAEQKANAPIERRAQKERAAKIEEKKRLLLEEQAAVSEEQNRLEQESQIALKEKAHMQSWPNTRMPAGPPNKTAGLLILQHSHDEEEPWFILTSVTAGCMACFEDRLMIVKAGNMQGYMSGTLFGGRSTTFYYSDINAIEFNKQPFGSVLEILTASYDGGPNHDFWRGTFQSRNSNSGDPYTLNNTLPINNITYNNARAEMSELRKRISAAKQTTVNVTLPAPPPAPAQIAPPNEDLVAKLAKLGELRDAGVLSDEEFAAAKARLLS